MGDMRSTLANALRLNEGHVDSMRKNEATFTSEESQLIETLRSHPAFASFDKDQLDRHTLKHLFVSISDQPVSVCERTASKLEKLLNSNKIGTDLVIKNQLTEGEEVPVERPEVASGKGELKQGPADTTASDHEGKDVGGAAKDHPTGDADQGADQDKDKHGDKSEIAKDGYMSEKEKEDDLPDEDMEEDADGVGDAKDDRDANIGGKDKSENIDTEDPKQAGKAAKDLPEKEKDDDDDDDDMEEDAPPMQSAPASAPAAAPAMPMKKVEKMKEAKKSLKEKRRGLKEKLRQVREALSGLKESEMPDFMAKKDELKKKEEKLERKLKENKTLLKAVKESIKALKEDEVPKDAKDPADDDEHRAANDATYKDGKGQNEGKVTEHDLSQPDETKDASDLPDYDKVQKEDPSNSELNKGPIDPKLESLDKIEERICSILREAGIKKGSLRWTEAYQRGWQLAMEHRVQKISDRK